MDQYNNSKQWNLNSDFGMDFSFLSNDYSQNNMMFQQFEPIFTPQNPKLQTITPMQEINRTGSNESSATDQSELDYDDLPNPVVKSQKTSYINHNKCEWTDCREEYASMEEMILHVTEIHINSGKSNYKCKWTHCKRDQKPFTKRHKMLNHFRTHTGEKPYLCEFPNCKKAFSRSDSLATHEKTHSDSKPYTCSIKGCNRSYYHSRSLRKHVKSHQDGRDFPYSLY